MEEKKARGEPVEDPKMDVVLRQSEANLARLAAENEEPTHRLKIKYSDPATPSLYANIEQCRPLFGKFENMLNLLKMYRKPLIFSF